MRRGPEHRDRAVMMGGWQTLPARRSRGARSSSVSVDSVPLRCCPRPVAAISAPTNPPAPTVVADAGRAGPDQRTDRDDPPAPAAAGCRDRRRPGGRAAVDAVAGRPAGPPDRTGGRVRQDRTRRRPPAPRPTHRGRRVPPPARSRCPTHRRPSSRRFAATPQRRRSSSPTRRRRPRATGRRLFGSIAASLASHRAVLA